MRIPAAESKVLSLSRRLCDLKAVNERNGRGALSGGGYNLKEALGDMLDRLSSTLNRVSSFLGCGFFVLGLSCVLLQIIGRQFNLFPIYWQEELARYSFIIVTLCGSIIAVSKNGHLKIDLLLDLFPQKPRRYIEVFIQIIVILFLIALTYLSFDTAIFNIRRRTPALQISWSIMYFLVVAASVLMMFQSLINIKRLTEGK